MVDSTAQAPVLPTLFLPGFARSATTWLHRCMHAAFRPAVVCDSDESGEWNRTCNGRRFLVHPISSNAIGDTRTVKEPFYFGGSHSTPYNDDQLGLHGPPTPLWLWQDKSTSIARRRHIAATCSTHPPWRAPRARHGQLLSSRCSRQGLGIRSWHGNYLRSLSPPANSCVHPGCIRIARAVPATWSGPCSWPRSQGHALGADGDDAAYCLASSLPWLSAVESERVVAADFTPNYLCDADAMLRIRASAADPSALRFVVLLRDPALRAISEWACVHALAFLSHYLDRPHSILSAAYAICLTLSSRSAHAQLTFNTVRMAIFLWQAL